MKTQEILKELNYTLNQEKDKTYDTCSTNWRSLLGAVICKIEEMEKEKEKFINSIVKLSDLNKQLKQDADKWKYFKKQLEDTNLTLGRMFLTGFEHLDIDDFEYQYKSSKENVLK